MWLCICCMHDYLQLSAFSTGMKNHLTSLSCRLGFACSSNNLSTTLRRPFWLAAMRAVQPFCVNWSSLSSQNQLLVHNTVPSISNTQNTLDLHYPSGPQWLFLQVTYPQLVDVHCGMQSSEPSTHSIQIYKMHCMYVVEIQDSGLSTLKLL